MLQAGTRAPTQADLERSQAEFIGLALEPYPLEESIPEMESRGIRCDSPKPFISLLPRKDARAL
jgi:hypothetical protein